MAVKAWNTFFFIGKAISCSILCFIFEEDRRGLGSWSEAERTERVKLGNPVLDMDCCLLDLICRRKKEAGICVSFWTQAVYALASCSTSEYIKGSKERC